MNLDKNVTNRSKFLDVIGIMAAAEKRPGRASSTLGKSARRGSMFIFQYQFPKKPQAWLLFMEVPIGVGLPTAGDGTGRRPVSPEIVFASLDDSTSTSNIIVFRIVDNERSRLGLPSGVCCMVVSPPNRNTRLELILREPTIEYVSDVERELCCSCDYRRSRNRLSERLGTAWQVAWTGCALT